MFTLLREESSSYQWNLGTKPSKLPGIQSRSVLQFRFLFLQCCLLGPAVFSQNWTWTFLVFLGTSHSANLHLLCLKSPQTWERSSSYVLQWKKQECYKCALNSKKELSTYSFMFFIETVCWENSLFIIVCSTWRNCLHKRYRKFLLF